MGPCQCRSHYFFPTGVSKSLVLCFSGPDGARQGTGSALWCEQRPPTQTPNCWGGRELPARCQTCSKEPTSSFQGMIFLKSISKYLGHKHRRHFLCTQIHKLKDYLDSFFTTDSRLTFSLSSSRRMEPKHNLKVMQSVFQDPMLQSPAKKGPPKLNPEPPFPHNTNSRNSDNLMDADFAS